MGMVFKKIFREGIQQRPFKAHKRYEVTDVNYSSSFEISILRAISDNGVLLEVSRSVSGSNTPDPRIISGAGAASAELNHIPQQINWYSINSTFFKNTNRHLYETASIVSIPQNKFGEGIKPGSVYMTCSSAATSASYLRDIEVNDEYGVLIDPNVVISNFVEPGYNILKIGFDTVKKGLAWKLTKDESTYDNLLKPSEIIVSDGPTTSGGLGGVVGKSVSSTISSSFVVRHKPHFNVLNHQDNWAVSLYVNLPPTQSFLNNSTNTIISKRWTHYDPYLNSEVYSHYNTYPFDLSVYNSNIVDAEGKLRLSVSDGRWDYTNEVEGVHVTSSILVNDGLWHNVIINKTGSYYKLYIDGQLNGVITGSDFASINNTKDITIFSSRAEYTDDYTATSGSFDAVNIYKVGLTSDNITSLSNNNWYSGSFGQSNKVGYVFYKHGMIIVSDPRPKYRNMFLGDGAFDYTNRGFEINYKSTKQIEEVSILCEINRDEYNVSSNPSLKLTYDENEHRLKSMVTGSDFSPYITQVGLYNDFGDLLAVAKLGAPLKKRQDVDVTINVKFDLD